MIQNLNLLDQGLRFQVKVLKFNIESSKLDYFINF